MKAIFSSLFILFTTVMTGCATKSNSMYAWGTLPQQHYLMYTQPQKATPNQQIKALEAQIEKTKANNQTIPPGLYAHLGLMYSMIQQMNQANHYFNLERQLYPESSILMNRLLQTKQEQSKQDNVQNKEQSKVAVQTTAGSNK